jgi:hypothetical protein
MQRNTLLLTALLAVIASFMLGLNIGKSIGSVKPAPAPAPTPAKTPVVMLPFTNEKCGVTFQYPSNLQLAESTGSGVIFYDSDHPELSVAFACQPDIPRPALPTNKIESKSIPYTTTSATVSAKLYHDTSAKDGSPIDSLIFYQPKKATDIWIAGYGKIFSELLKTVKLLP